jgi:hypothetical protein
MIDITKKYKTRDGRAVTGLRAATGHEGWLDEYTIVGELDGGDAAWMSDGRYHELYPENPSDLVLADEPEKPGLLTPDPLRVEYGTFVAAVKANFAAGTFATATQDQFDLWLESLTPNLRA